MYERKVSGSGFVSGDIGGSVRVSFFSKRELSGRELSAWGYCLGGNLPVTISDIFLNGSFVFCVIFSNANLKFVAYF